jgi:hypothetical protein
MFLRLAIAATLSVSLVRCATCPPCALPAPSAKRYDFDLDLAGKIDPNGFLLNPRWKRPGSPDPSRCSWRFVERNDDPADLRPPCNSLPVDPDFSNSALTEIGGTCLDSSLNMRGHILWERAWHRDGVKGGAVTFAGPVKWDSFSGKGLNDGDFNLVLTPPGGSVSTPGSHDVIKLEYNSDEVDHFASEWWKLFADAATRRDSTCKTERLVGSANGVVTGVLGLDSEHDSHLEVHPVYAMALNVPCPAQGAFNCASRADRDKSNLWALFVRDKGNLGGCSRDGRLHVIDLSDGYAFRLRGPRGARSLVRSGVYSEFCTSNRGAGSVELRADMHPNDPGVLVTFHIPWRGSVDGHLELQWANDKGDDDARWAVNFASGEKPCDSLRPFGVSRR